jgi:hypothetical protein
MPIGCRIAHFFAEECCIHIYPVAKCPISPKPSDLCAFEGAFSRFCVTRPDLRPEVAFADWLWTPHGTGIAQVCLGVT